MMDHPAYDFPLDPALTHDAEANDPDAEEAALEAIRVAINNNNHNSQTDHLHAPSGSSALGLGTNGDALPFHADVELDHVAPASRSAQIEQVIVKLQRLQGQTNGTLEGIHSAGVLAGAMRMLGEVAAGMKKQEEQFDDSSTIPALDQTLANSFVPRAEYDSLKQKYDVLLASTAVYAPPNGKGKAPLRGDTPIVAPAAEVASPSASAVHPPPSKKRKARPSKGSQSVAPEDHGEALQEVKEGQDEEDDKPQLGQSGRKRRSVKLEHLVHQMANRRLGLEYPISGFRVAGSTELPDPATPAPPPNMSVNGVQEYRPDFTKSVEDGEVGRYVGVVVQDAWAAWTGGVGEGEVGVDEAKVQEAVETYWLRLQKRWLEQQARIRGEIHKDELTRRKQNQYRRQQSLVGRRIAAFDASPLNACRLRALYRTLLTIDFAPPTNERPDPSRVYTEDQWAAYRRKALGGRAGLGHEIVDIFWLSPAARSFLILLDIFSTARLSAVGRKKGRPKAPSPTFHLPSSLWDASPARLPLLRPKDADGLPMPETPGIILFHFHVHPDIIAQYPAWAAGLYDDPPPDAADVGLGRLAEVLADEGYAIFRERIRKEKERVVVPEMSEVEVREVLGRPEEDGEGEEEEEELVIDVPARSASAVSQIQPDSAAGPGSVGVIDYSGINLLSGLDTDALSSSLEEGLESYVALSQAAQVEAAMQAAGDAGSVADTAVGPGYEREETAASVDKPSGSSTGKGTRGGGSIGTSSRARKMGKKAAHGPPEGAAVPVAKRRRVDLGMGMGGMAGEVVMGGMDDARREIESDAQFLGGL